jgi:hypothetical protein
MQIQETLTKEEMSVVGESLYYYMNNIKKEKELKEQEGNLTDRDKRIYELKYKQLEDVWRKVMKGWVASLTGMMVQPVMTKE